MALPSACECSSGIDYTQAALVDAVTPQHLSAWTGKGLPTLAYRGTDAVGADELVSGTHPLVDSIAPNAPTKQAASANLGANCTLFSAGSNYMQAADAAAGNNGTDSFVGILVVDIVGWATSAGVMSKRQVGSGDYGWDHETQVFGIGRPQATFDSVAGQFLRGTTITHAIGAHVFMYQRQASDDYLGFTSIEYTGFTIGAVGNLDNTGKLTIGKSSHATASTSMYFGGYYEWSGAAAEGWTAADRTTIAQKLGVE